MYTDCCSDAERLLWWTLRKHEREVPVTFDLLPPGNAAGAQVLRYVDGVCETIFDVRYQRVGYFMNKQMEGLPVGTGKALERRFGVDELMPIISLPAANRTAAQEDALKRAIAACRDALGAQPKKPHFPRPYAPPRRTPTGVSDAEVARYRAVIL